MSASKLAAKSKVLYQTIHGTHDVVDELLAEERASVQDKRGKTLQEIQAKRRLVHLLEKGSMELNDLMNRVIEIKSAVTPRDDHMVEAMARARLIAH